MLLPTCPSLTAAQQAKKKLAFVAAAAGSGPADNAKCDTKKTSKTADSVVTSHSWCRA